MLMIVVLATPKTTILPPWMTLLMVMMMMMVVVIMMIVMMGDVQNRPCRSCTTARPSSILNNSRECKLLGQHATLLKPRLKWKGLV